MSDVLNVLTAIENYLVDLPAKILLKADQIYIVNGLSDVSENLGIVTAGEFRSGNRLDPGKLFSGMRMSYPPMTYGASDWNLVGVNADTLQFGVRASDGKLLAGGGAVILDSTGITATAGLIAGWVINSDHLLSDGTPGIKILSTGAIETSDFVSGILGKGWRISEAGNAEFNNAVIRGELRTTVLSYQEVQAVSGTMGVFQSAGVIMETTGAVPAVASSMNIKVKDPEYGHTALFAVNDVVWIKDGTNATWFTVTTVTDNTTYYTYACKVESGSTGNVYTAGQAIVNFGVAGEGYLLMEAIGTGAPYFSVRTTSAAPWTGSTNPEHVRMGNLDGNWGYSSAIYGSAIGKYATGVGNITIDPTNGVRIRVYDTTIMEFKSTGAFITNVLNMTGANAAIAIGATPPTAKDAGTGLWLSKDGLFSLASNVYQVKIDASDGKLYAGGGNVTIDADGIKLSPGDGASSRIKFGLYSWMNVLSDTGGDTLYTRNHRLGDVISSVVTVASTNLKYSGLVLSTSDSYFVGRMLQWISWNNNIDPIYTSASSITFEGTNVSSVFPAGTKIKLIQASIKYFYVLSVVYSGGNTILTLTGGSNYTVSNSAITSFYYSHAAVADSMPFGSSTFIPLITPLTSTSWDGDSFSTTAKTLIDLSAVFGVPDGVKAVMVTVAVRDSASQTSDTVLTLSPNNTAGVGIRFSPQYVNDRYGRTSGIVPCNANGDIYYQIDASGAGTFDVVLQIWSYWI